MKKINLLYFSATDTTKKVVKTIAQQLGEIANEYDITLPALRERELFFSDNDLVVFGVPVYAGRVPGFLAEYLKKIKGNNSQAVFIVLYGNRDYDDALLEFKNIMEGQGFHGHAAGAFIGEHSLTSKVANGRPDQDDLQIAKAFGKQIKEKLERTNDKKELIVKGNFPYRKGMTPSPPIGPSTDDSCIQCGICAAHCPTGSIDFKDCTIIDPEKCVRCCSCVKRCPKHSKFFSQDIIKGTIKRLEENYLEVRKQPKLFI
ncbi:MAG: EFR1 family ferrodoxin [Eubacteriales bacterium]